MTTIHLFREILSLVFYSSQSIVGLFTINQILHPVEITIAQSIILAGSILYWFITVYTRTLM